MAPLASQEAVPSRIPAPVRGALWMIAACTLLGSMNVLVRYLSQELPVLEIVFFRNLGQLVFMLPWLVGNGLAAARTRRLGMQIGRAGVSLFSMIVWFTALSLMPVAEATALSFASPLFATLGAALILGETVRARRWTATTIGFLGALVILRPGLAGFSWSALLALGAAASFAGSTLILKSLSRTDPPSVCVFYMALLLTPVSLVPALFVWETPGLDLIGWLVVLGALAMFGHQALTRAYAAADASAVAPFDFFRLPVAAAIAYLAFGEAVGAWTWFGAAVIFCSSATLARREAGLAGDAQAGPRRRP